MNLLPTQELSLPPLKKTRALIVAGAMWASMNLALVPVL